MSGYERRPVGFLVWNPDREMPRHVHATLAEATAEAERLLRLNPRQRFYVMAPLTLVGDIRAASQYARGHAEGIAEAHREIMCAERRADEAIEWRMANETRLTALLPLVRRAERYVGVVMAVAGWLSGVAFVTPPDERRRLGVLFPSPNELADLAEDLRIVAEGESKALRICEDDDNIPF